MGDESFNHLQELELGVDTTAQATDARDRGRRKGRSKKGEIQPASCVQGSSAVGNFQRRR